MTALLSILLAATIPLRNPFWPIGFDGPLEAIGTETNLNVRAGAAQAGQRPSPVVLDDETLWNLARQSLKFGGTLRTSNNRQAMTINGRVYADGDLISTNVRGRRFTWRVRQLTETGELRLQRIRFRDLDENADMKGTKR